MAQFLSWLFGVAGSVYDWFGTEYWTLRNGAANAWNWAVSNAQAALNSAVNYAYAKFQQAEYDISGLFGWVQSQLNNIGQSLAPVIASIETTVTNWFDARLQDVWSFAQSVQLQAQGLVNGLRLDITTWVNGLVPGIISTVSSIFEWVNVIRSNIEALINVFTPDNMQKILKVFGEWWNALTLFLDNPVVFILDLIEPVILDFLSFVIAWALGTTENELPKDATWRK